MRKLFFSFALLCLSVAGWGNSRHPLLLLSPAGVERIRTEAGRIPEFDRVVRETVAAADAAIAHGVEIPVPRDHGGGYSHERHKDNYYDLYHCGLAYQLTGREAYARFVREMLEGYAAMYPGLGPHPANQRPDQAGRLFWQPLNDCVWLCHAALAYDCIYEWLAESERQKLEGDLFRPMAEFLSNGTERTRKTFDMMHNHGTWATVAVGMIGHVMGDRDLVEKSLYGLKKDGKGGFLRQLDELFSPDGYYTEGAYYQRYALWPFVVYAQVLDNNHPQMKIFAYRDGLLGKATRAVLDLSYNGELFRINDAVYQTVDALEIVHAVDASYAADPSCKELLSVAASQGTYVISDAGLVTAAAVSRGEAQPFRPQSRLLRDGADGKQGAVAVIRQGEGDRHTALLLKASSHGRSHGHYDKLSILLFDNGNEILSDYGSVRYLNLEPRNGGDYTRENRTWALQTIAHNTVTVDSTSHFNGDIRVSERHWSQIDYAAFDDPHVQVVSASDRNAAPGVEMRRTLAVIADPSLEFPMVIDLFGLRSGSEHCYDLPYYWRGTLSETNFGMKRHAGSFPVLGGGNGYQNLWVEGTAAAVAPLSRITWFNADRFYSLTTLTGGDEQLYFVRMGANDPQMNILDRPGYLIRKPAARNHTFVSVLDIHGEYDLVRELTREFHSQVEGIELLRDDERYTAVRITLSRGRSCLFVTRNRDFSPSGENRLEFDGRSYVWQGNYGCFFESGK